MQEKLLFEYAVIRVVPHVEREEFLNVGVIVYCSAQGFLQTLFEVDKKRLHCFAPNIKIEELEERLRAFEKICAGSPEGGPIAKLPIASRFRWLTATRSTIIQISPVHPGLCVNPAEKLGDLHAKLVLVNGWND